MELIAEISRTDPRLAEDLMRLLNEIELARMEHMMAGKRGETARRP